MNKMIKGSIAGATGIAVLMGGFGTYALWSDAATLEDSSITSGVLTVASNDDVKWNDTNDTTSDNDWNYDGGALMVPGDVVTRTESYVFDSAGENLEGAVNFDLVSGSEPSLADSDADGPDAADLFNIKVTLSGPGVSLTQDDNDDCWTFAADDLDGDVVTAVVEYSLEADRTDLQDATASIPDATFTVTQDATCS